MNDIVTTVVGRITHAPQRRALDGRREVVTFRMACNHRYFDRAAGVWKESSTSYVSVDVWRQQLGRCVMGSLAKGDPVVAHGRMLVREYEQEGRMRSAVTLVAEAVGPDLNHAMAALTRITRPAAGAAGDGARADDAGAAAGFGSDAEGGSPVIDVPALLEDGLDSAPRGGLALVGAASGEDDGTDGEPDDREVR
ncbi:hypothetical protein GCM10009836_64830 [Pseudonocardia ailaonensis]|uniref:Single-stranded DNA-binding protein n=1 Tax=Pseudonocardia ailaonensis TaxID=367279 RepID=A0ABN2NLN1_9PSEU